MENVEAEKSPFSKVNQIGVVVRDMDRAVEYYQSLGIGPFEPLQNVIFVYKEVLGKAIDPDSIKLKIRIAKVGPVDLELIQPIEGESLWKEFLETRGEGINHLGFLVEDIDKEEAKLVAKGFTVLYRSRFKNGGGATYFDTGKIGGVLLELMKWPPQ
jgi:catechol 2,3-dioxygenase-like lactoylglutathione lyase family enzyme